MKTIVRGLAAVVRRAPVAVILTVLVLTVAFGFFAPQLEQTHGIQVFAPQNNQLLALQTIEERFGASEGSVQVLIESPSGDVISADGLQEVLAVEQAIRTSPYAARLADRPDGPIVGYLTPTWRAVQAMGYSMSALNDTIVKSAFALSLSQIPEDQRRLFTGLLSSATTDLDAKTSGTGLMVVFFDLSGLDLDGIQSLERGVQGLVAGVSVGGVTATAFSYELMLTVDPIEKELTRLFLLAGGTIVLILATVYWDRPKVRAHWLPAVRRTFADLGLTMAAIVISIIWMLGIGVLLGPKYLGVIGNFSPLLQVLPVLMVGLGVDYAIHLTSRYREELGKGRSVPESARQATALVGIALVLATVTTSVGFFTNIANPIPPLQDFAVLAAIGIVSAFLVMLTFVPSVRWLLDRRAERNDRLPREEFEEPERRLITNAMSKTAVLAERLAIPTLCLALALTGLGVFGMTRLDTEFSATDFVPENDPLRAASATLTSQFAGGFGETTEVLMEGDVATPAFHNALLAATINLAGTDRVITLGGRAAAESPISVIASLLTPDAAGVPASPEFAAFASANGMNADLTVSPAADVDAIYREALARAPAGMSSVLATGEGDRFQYARVSVSTQAGEDGAAQLAGDLTDVFAGVGALPGIDVTPTSSNIVTISVIEALRDSQSVSVVITLVAAMLLLVLSFWYEFRRPLLGVLTILPVVFVVLWTYGLMAAFGIPFGPVTAMVSALAVGIGVPYTIHVTHRYLEDRTRYDDPEAAMRSTAGHTGGALAGSAFTTLAGFGVLMTSGLVPFQQFGAVTALAIGLSLLASVGVLPSMLILWDRWHRRRGEAPSEAVMDLPKGPVGVG